MFFNSSRQRVLAALLAVAFVVTACGSINAFAAKATPPDTSASEERVDQLNKDIDEYNKKIEQLGKDKQKEEERLKVMVQKIDAVKEKIEILDKEIEPIRKELDNLQTAINNAQADIDKLEKDIPEKQKEYDSVFAQYEVRMRAMYTTGPANIIQLILSANDISTMLIRIQMISNISDENEKQLKQLQNLMDELKTEKQKLEKQKETLNTSKVSLLAKKTEYDEKLVPLENEKASLEKDVADANEVIKNLANESGNYSELLEVSEKEKERLEAEIAQAIKDYEDSLTETSSTTQGTTSGGTGGSTTKPPQTTKPTEGTGVFTHPCPGYTRISATFPYYSSGAYHSGVDFAAKEGTPIYAADSGVVIIAKRLTTSYGRYVLIRHKKGLYTLYAHTKDFFVEVGDTVQKGQKIAEVGNTGNSFGAHLHFEVRTGNGNYSDCVDPMKYL